MRDVARAVNLSPMTVSRALRNDDTVNPQTRKLIEAAAAELGYVYDSTASTFRTKKSGFVAVIVPSINNANFADTFRGLSDGLEGHSTQLLLGSTNYEVEKEHALVLQLLARNPEAIVLTGGHHLPQTRSLIKKAKIPVIEIWDLPVDPLGHVVGFSNQTAMGQVVSHLEQKELRKIAFVGAAKGSDLRGAARRDGVVSHAKTLGLPDVTIIDAGQAPISMRQGSQVVARMGDAISEFDALVCVSDPVAFGVLSECQRLGLKVPKNVAITGFGNFDLATTSCPRITSVGVHANEIGQKVAGVLQDIFAGETEPQWIDVGSKLILGETT